MRGKALLCVLALGSAAPAVRAEPVYVIEQLIVSVASAPGGAGEHIGQVKSGDRLELLERQGGESHIRLASGKDGWIRSSYLSAEQPLQFRLNERTAELDKLKQDVSRLESELAAARAAHSSAAATPASQRQSPPAMQPASPGQPASAAPHEAIFLTEPAAKGHAPWAWILGTGTVTLLAGFGLGWRSLDRRIRRKYGGLRIY